MPRWIALVMVSGCAAEPSGVALPPLTELECAGVHGCFRVWSSEGPCTGELDGHVGTGHGSALFGVQGSCTDGSDMSVVIEGQGLLADIAPDAEPPAGTGVVGVGAQQFVNEVGQGFDWLADRPATTQDGSFVLDLEPKGSPVTRVEAWVVWDLL